MKKLLTLLMSSSLLISISSTVVSCKTIGLISYSDIMNLNSDLSFQLDSYKNNLEESVAKELWFQKNKDKIIGVASEATVDWFDSANFEPGDTLNSGKIKISATKEHPEFTNEVEITIKILPAVGTLDHSVGNGTGIIENETFDSGVYSMIQLSNGIILAGTNAGSMYKLTDEGKIDTSIGNGGIIENKLGSVNYLFQHSNGLILASFGGNIICKLTDNGKLDTSVGDGTGIVQSFDSAGNVQWLQELSNGKILAGLDNDKIYQLTNEGKIDTSVGDGTGILYDNIVTKESSISKLSNGKIFLSSDKIIYQLNEDGSIDTSVGGGTGKIDEEFTSTISSIIQLSNGVIILLATNGSIYKLTDEGKIDKSINNGSGILENGTLKKYLYAHCIQLSNGFILQGAGINIERGSIYKLVN
ncbi:hypothetical protein [Spiroplasma endosymbiont of Labia minor]|uniref:hypothetical protein n=1 Tax=Spiroplasma endosymbiont of Labia minor TaxID=3066305 RepID=UPI0030CE7A15